MNDYEILKTIEQHEKDMLRYAKHRKLVSTAKKHGKTKVRLHVLRQLLVTLMHRL